MRPEAPSLLWDARRAAQYVRAFLEGRTKVEYDADVMLQSAVERQFGIVGEALNRLRKVDPSTAAQVPDLDGIVGFHNVLIHGYAAVDNDIVWDLATVRTTGLIDALDSLLA